MFFIVETLHGRRNILTMQRTALPACLAVFKTVSTDALQVVAAAMPWDLEAIRAAIIYKVKRGLALIPRARVLWT